MGGQPLSAVEAIRREMDRLHKVVAELLFTGAAHPAEEMREANSAR